MSRAGHLSRLPAPVMERRGELLYFSERSVCGLCRAIFPQMSLYQPIPEMSRVVEQDKAGVSKENINTLIASAGGAIAGTAAAAGVFAGPGRKYLFYKDNKKHLRSY